MFINPLPKAQNIAQLLIHDGGEYEIRMRETRSFYRILVGVNIFRNTHSKHGREDRKTIDNTKTVGGNWWQGGLGEGLSTIANDVR
jgi:hypothetical protein